MQSMTTYAKRGACTCAAMMAAVLTFGSTSASSAEIGNDAQVVVDLVSTGQFDAAEKRIDTDLQQPDLSAATRRVLEFQRERMARVHYDFSLDADQLEAKVREKIPDLSAADFARWNARGLFESMLIDGQRRYFKRAPANLFHISAEARARARDLEAVADSGLPKAVQGMYLDFDRKTINAALDHGRSSVLPQRVRVTQTVTVDADAVPAGKVLRAWIPYPRAIQGRQDDIRFVSSEPARHRIAPESALQRTAYLERKARAGTPTVFSTTYEVTLHAQYHAIDANQVVAEKITPELAPYVAERAPHIVFTEPLRVFSRQIVGGETNPYRIARKIFAAVDEIPWAGAREYSTIANLSDYALHAGHGDCGEQTLLLIALMRLNGIPARWQSGWTFTDGDYENIHDWAEIHLAPYGWIPVDVTYGRLDSDDPALKWFYLGGLDNFRIAFNDDFSQELVPPKRFFRSDTVDSQRGEVEWDEGNLYYDKWNYDFRWKILSSKPD